MQTEESVSAACCAAYDPMLDRAAEIVMAYVGRNAVPIGDLPGLIASVHSALVDLTQRQRAVEPEVAKPSPAEIRRSVTHDTLTSFEDGKPYKTLRRHLTLRGLTPEAYRAKWGLPVDYPMTSAAYSAQRSDLAHKLGLGQQRRKSEAPLQAVA